MSDFATGLYGALDVHTQRCRVGRIVRTRSDGRPVVTYPGCVPGGVEAKVLTGIPAAGQFQDQETVLLLFPEGQRQPIIVGGVADHVPIEARPVQGPASPELPLRHHRPDTILADNKRVIIEAQKEIILKCGQSTIILRQDGKVVVRGRRLISRASESNKIRGGSVLIN